VRYSVSNQNRANFNDVSKIGIWYNKQPTFRSSVTKEPYNQESNFYDKMRSSTDVRKSMNYGDDKRFEI
jgi:hypothetical protein